MRSKDFDWYFADDTAVRGKVKTATVRYSLFLKDLCVIHPLLCSSQAKPNDPAQSAGVGVGTC